MHKKNGIAFQWVMYNFSLFRVVCFIFQKQFQERMLRKMVLHWWLELESIAFQSVCLGWCNFTKDPIKIQSDL